MSFGVGPIPFLLCLAEGVVMGCLYLLIKLIEKRAKANCVCKNIIDCIFVLLTAALYFVVVFYSMEGVFRLFTLIGLGLGFLLVFLCCRYIPQLTKKIAHKGRN